ncbi:molybdate transport system ATP-binding protein [Rhodopseudomonas thermotolerans]|uniref:Molybdate transport system ATP-binding protein n=2 Tax=Rhodopseudomonas TaxID=1073 RepID=A0A336JU43_9BRAD|nr:MULTISPECIES: ATP-binding cassette domain-containing protein [Rhodopseudomonas]RED25812.1 molybdate transport system ATP-binding protein [Rhodopseudomonas pentothenatexigens]REF90441.1 molybdate transport system ATP-binding protein [Rhodopseudomonas thermotolerans]SSW93140.1 molybdate transport system ATP-binding protein [Rhodopseudomonas pentothenatexigens]
MAEEIALQVRMPLTGPAGPFALDIDLKIATGALVAIAGPSGSGKTTLLRAIAGLARPAEGRVRVGTALWCDTAARIHVPTRQRSIGLVFQDYALFPNMTVRGNVDYAIGSRARSDEVDELLQLVELDGLADAMPDRLSGGQKQRLALIRALARQPSLLMLDEPLSALDPAMRRKLQDDLLRLHRRFGTTTLLVSHDPSEILRLADRVIRLEHGEVVFDGTPAASLVGAVGEDPLLLTGIYLGACDSSDACAVLVEGRTLRLRLSEVSGLGVGDPVTLRIDDAVVQRHAPGHRDRLNGCPASAAESAEFPRI